MGRFDYISIRPVDRQRLNRILDEITKLDNVKRNYSIQELQSMNLLDDRRKNENQRILEELNSFLNAATNLSSIEKPGIRDARNEYDTYMKKRNVSDNVTIDVSELSQKVYTLADLSFKVNKYTKWLCSDAIDLIAPRGGNFRRETVDVLKGIYRKSKTEDGIRIGLDDELEDLANERSAVGYDKEIIKSRLKKIYNDLEPIWDLEEMLYEIKNQLNLQLLRCLIKDNYREFNNWGFSKDDDGNWILNFDPTNVAERYAFHMPPSRRNMPKSEQLTKILSRGLIGRVVRQTIMEYRNTITKDVRKNNRDTINRQTMIDFFRNRKSRIIDCLQRRSDIDLPLYIMAKFMPRSAFEEIEREHPELIGKCEMLKELISPTHLRSLDLEQTELSKTTEYQDKIRNQIEDTLIRTKKIYVQRRTEFR